MTFKDRTKVVTSVNANPNWLSLLGVIFVLLKVCGVTMVATWSWWLVLLPFYMGLAFIAVVLLGFGAVALLAGVGIGVLSVFEHFAQKRRQAKYNQSRLK